MTHYDVTILGGGPAGYRAALCLAERGKHVLMIERAEVGGTCLHRGCIPTKSLLNNVGKIAPEELYKQKERDVHRLWKGLQWQLSKSDVEVIYGEGIIQNRQDNGFCVTVHENEYFSDDLIIATGSKSRQLDVAGLAAAMEQGFAVNSDGFLARDTLPERIVFVGGGVIGIEFATYAAKLGKAVCIIEALDNVLPKMIDDDIRDILVRWLTESGVTIIPNAFLESVEDGGVIYRQNGNYDELPSDLTVVAGGRVGNTRGFGLENIGVAVQNSFIPVNPSGETDVPGVYACGDVIGKSMLAHSAYREAEVVVDNICGESAQMSYRAIPSVVFSDPEIAVTGLTEQDCIEGKIDYYVKKCSMNSSSKYSILYGRQPGLCKLVFNADRELIGAQMIGNGSSEVIFTLSDMISEHKTEKMIRDKIYPHPSIIEVIKQAVTS